ncbi:MAG: hypothetical protein ACRD3O_00925 [Terriglobia bacterium]
MDCRHLEDLYELFLLGALSSAEEAQVREHVERRCPSCLEGIRESSLVLYALLQTCRPVRSTSTQKDHLLQTLKEK